MTVKANPSPIDDCSHRPPCPGCPYFGAHSIAENALDRIQKWEQKAASFTVHQGPRLEWRHRARLAVRGRTNSPKIGIFQAHSHRIVDIPSCPLHHPMINRAAKSLKNALRRLRIAPYHEASHRGEVRYVQLVIERPTNRVQVTVVGKTEGSDAAGHLSEALIDDLGDALHSVYWNTQPLRSNTIFGNETRRLHGEPYIQDHLPHATTFTPADAFGQANPAAAEKMIEELRKFITHRAHVADLYCGVGPIGLSLLDIASKITFVEVAPGSLSGLRQGIAALPTSDHERVAVHEGAVDEHLDACHGAEVVIADPPRKGLDDKLVRALCRIVPKTVIVIHCGLAAFERDLTSLVVNGPFQIQHLSAHDFFPHSGHAEVMTVLVPSEAI